MESLILAGVTLLGGVMNRIRGGWFDLPMNKVIEVLVFTFVMWLGLSLALWQIPVLALAMYIGQAPGWGVYIGALGGWEKNALKEFWLVDFFIKPLKPWKRLWGYFGLSLRGAFWGGLIGLAVWSYIPLIAGLTMGTIYFITIELAKKLFPNQNWQGIGWELGEVGFGAVLWGLVWYSKRKK